LLLALALRVLLWSRPLHQLANDEVEYVAVARDLLAGRGWQFYQHYHWLRAPLYPLFLAGSLWLAGGDPSTGEALHRAALPNIAISVATVYLSYRLALVLVGRRAAPLAALLTAILWTLATFASLYMCETLFTFLFMAGLLCLLGSGSQPAAEPGDSPGLSLPRLAVLHRLPWPAIGAGLFFGLATLTRSISLLFLPIAALWLLFRQPPMIDDRRPAGFARKSWSAIASRLCMPAAFLLAAALAIAPWTIRNYIAYGRPILVETGLSYNLWAFNEPLEDQQTIFQVLENIPNPADRSDYATAKGLARLRQDPAIIARKLWPGWIYLWRVKAIEDRFIQESYYGDIGLPMFVTALIFDDLLYWVIALAGIAGLVLYRSGAQHDSWLRSAIDRLRSILGRPKSLLIAWLAYALPTILVTHAETRYRQFLFPILIPYAAWALVQVWRQPSERPSRLSAWFGVAGSGRLLVIAALSVSIVTVWVVYYPREWASQNLGRGWHALAAQLAWAAGNRDAALREDERAIAVKETPDGWIQLGDHARAAGDSRRALSAYRAAVALTPPYVAAVAHLGDMLRGLGDPAAARRAFIGDYVDQQRLADWSWRELGPAPQRLLDVGGGLDFGYIGGVYAAEQQQGASARWTRDRAFLRLGASGPANARTTLRLRLAAPRPDGKPALVQVCLLGRCHLLSVGPTWRTYLLPFDITSDRPLLVELRGDTFEAPEGRRLGVLIDWADIQNR
jgi:4-amino-4-deoxy-L-arabinose transferase-like glycosyltransferase